jgi:hypothetical protein
MLHGRRWSWVVLGALALSAAPAVGQNTITLPAIADSWFSYTSPGSNNNTDTNLKVGWDEDADTDGPVKNTVLLFDLSQVPHGVPILRATLGLFCHNDGQGSGDLYVGVMSARLTASWVPPEVTWDHRDEAGNVYWTPAPPGLREERGGLSDEEDDTEVTIGPDPNEAQYHEDQYALWDVTDTVAEWTENGEPNYGILLYADDADLNGSTATLSFYSRESTNPNRPYLFIEWDDDPPTPNPMSFSTLPHAVSPSAIAMTAALATDTQSPPVEYEFECTGGGGAGRTWGLARDYTNGALSANTQYTYRVRARDAVDNRTGFSATASAYTWANIPLRPTLYGATAHTMKIQLETMPPYINPPYTEYALGCLATNPPDPHWLNKYVNASGDPVPAAVWQTNTTWGVTTIRGLQAGTTYTFAAKARNVELVQTVFGPGATLTTVSPTGTGDLNCDGAVGFGDINPFVLALSNPSAYASAYADCNALNADINGDGVVNFTDINPFVALLSGGSSGS